MVNILETQREPRNPRFLCRLFVATFFSINPAAWLIHARRRTEQLDDGEVKYARKGLLDGNSPVVVAKRGAWKLNANIAIVTVRDWTKDAPMTVPRLASGCQGAQAR